VGDGSLSFEISGEATLEGCSKIEKLYTVLSGLPELIAALHRRWLSKSRHQTRRPMGITYSVANDPYRYEIFAIVFYIKTLHSNRLRHVNPFRSSEGMYFTPIMIVHQTPAECLNNNHQQIECCNDYLRCQSNLVKQEILYKIYLSC